MNDSDLVLRPSSSAGAVVPMDYAEKAMGSLMQLHSELMEEKERRVDLYRRLMEREQAVAELRMYVKLLEDKVAKAEVPEQQSVEAPEPRPSRPEPVARMAPRPPPPPPPRPLTLVRAPAAPRASAPRPPSPPDAPAESSPETRRPAARGFAASEGWKAW